MPSGGTSLQSQSAAKAALRGRGGAGTAADEDVPAVLGLLGPVLGLLGPVLGLFAGLLAPDAEDGEAGATVSAVHLHRPQVDAQKPFGFAELVLVIKLAEQAPKPFCIAEQRECAQVCIPCAQWTAAIAGTIHTLTVTVHMGALPMPQT